MVFATENDVLNGLGMLFMELLTNRAQIFADVRTYWSPEATKRVTGYDLEGKAKENGGIIHLLNSGAACLDACGECTDENGNAVMKKWWEVTDEDIKKMTDATVWCEAGFDNFRGGGFSSHFVTRAEMPATMIRLNLVKGLGPVAADRRGLDRASARGGHRHPHGAHEPHLAVHLVHPALRRQGRQPV